MTVQERSVLSDIYKTLEGVDDCVKGMEGLEVSMVIALAKLGTLLLLGDADE